MKTVLSLEFGFFSVLTLLWPSLVGGIGFRLPNQDPEAIGRGNAFAATADNPSAIYYNPAGLTQLKGQHLQVGLYAITVNSSYFSPSGRSTETEFEIQGVPQLHYAFSPKEKPFALGFGVYAPYGLGVKWPEDAPFRSAGLEARLTYACLNPVAAWQVHPKLSLALGPTFNLGRVRFRQGIVAPGDAFDFQGDGVGVGLNAGLLWQPHSQWSFGVNYRGPTRLNFTGDSEARPFSAPERTSASLDFPQFVVFGVSFRPNPDWNIEVDVDWTDWDALNATTFRKSSGGVPVAFNWESGFLYELGVTRSLRNGYFISGGYFFSENSVPARDFIPTVPDTDQHVLSVGLGHKGPRWSWAAAYQFITGPWRSVSQSASPVVEGQYRFLNHALNVSLGYRF